MITLIRAAVERGFTSIDAAEVHPLCTESWSVRCWLFRGKVVIATKFGLPYGENGDQGGVVHPHLTWLTPTPNADISMAPQEARD
jgi:aryl-alcohol dehydrogenase-like predicted oxidoreductase